jgi:hypothetical protein
LTGKRTRLLPDFVRWITPMSHISGNSGAAQAGDGETLAAFARQMHPRDSLN